MHPELPARFGAVIEANVRDLEMTVRTRLVRVGHDHWYAERPIRGGSLVPDSAIERHLRLVVWFEGVGATGNGGQGA